MDFELALREAIGLTPQQQIFMLTDNNTAQHCLPLVQQTLNLPKEHILCLPDGEHHKNLDTVQQIWTFLTNNHATRQALLIILGGGVFTDMGGFAAATFMRGIPFVNIPTTLLAMVDAAQGGKTGIDYHDLKNHIGLFVAPKKTIVYPPFLKTLPAAQLLSGYAEMLKHALIASPLELIQILAFDLLEPDYEVLEELINRSIDIKQYIVEQDPEETSLRKALNFGHTIGHALEEYSLLKSKENAARPLLHGYAVIYGIVAELYISTQLLKFPTATLQQVVHFINQYYPKPTCPCKDYEQLIQLMQHDKKNPQANQINFTLLRQVGNPQINQYPTIQLITQSLDFLFSL